MWEKTWFFLYRSGNSVEFAFKSQPLSPHSHLGTKSCSEGGAFAWLIAEVGHPKVSGWPTCKVEALKTLRPQLQSFCSITGADHPKVLGWPNFKVKVLITGAGHHNIVGRPTLKVVGLPTLKVKVALTLKAGNPTTLGWPNLQATKQKPRLQATVQAGLFFVRSLSDRTKTPKVVGLPTFKVKATLTLKAGNPTTLGWPNLQATKQKPRLHCSLQAGLFFVRSLSDRTKTPKVVGLPTFKVKATLTLKAGNPTTLGWPNLQETKQKPRLHCSLQARLFFVRSLSDRTKTGCLTPRLQATVQAGSIFVRLLSDRTKMSRSNFINTISHQSEIND
ncbi:hypothetical protein DFH28DRAFT_922863 [Melampsora americana]|nr:hypothetical protein DFH28DRAFT_922863 [Melampsora americana]